MVARTKNTTRKRPVRTSLNGRQDVLLVEEKDPNKEYRVVNDTPGRVAKLRNMGWEIADGDEKLVSAMDDSNVDDKSKHVGDGTKAVVMSMPKDWYEDYQKEKARQNDRLEKATQANALQNGYCKVEIS